MNRAIVLGASGFLGCKLIHALGPDRSVGTCHTRTAAGLHGFDAKHDSIEWLANSAGGEFTHVYFLYGVSDIDSCAFDPLGSAALNVESVKRLILETVDLRMTPVFVSTDYVYDGTRGLRHEDEPQCPSTEYGRQKVRIEHWLQRLDAPWLVVRLSKLVSGDRGIHSVLGQAIDCFYEGTPLRVATDQIFSPSFVNDVARALVRLAEIDARGIIHVAGNERLSRFALIRLLTDAIRKRSSVLSMVVHKCQINDLPFVEKRPLDTSLATRKLTELLGMRFTSMVELCDSVAEFHFGDGPHKRPVSM